MAHDQGYYNLARFVGENYAETENLRCLCVFVPDGDEYAGQLLTLMNVAGTKAAWYTDTDEQRIARAEIWQKAYRMTHEVLMSGCFDCEQVDECLEPRFAALMDAVSALATMVAGMSVAIDQIGMGTEGSAARPPNEISQPTYDGEYIYAGALAVVQYMHKENMKLYAKAEESAADNVQEFISVVLASIPVFNELPFDEIFTLADGYYQNQVSAYEVDYPFFEEPAAFNLYCRIMANNKTFTYDVWGAWLADLFAYVPYPNAAADLFARYAPIRQTFLNQIAAFLNSNQSLESYFKRIYEQFFAGSQSGVSIPSGYTCDTAQVLFFDPNPPDARLAIATDGGQFGFADARRVESPFTVTIDLESVLTVTTVEVVAAFMTATGNTATVNGVAYDLVRGFHHGGETYTYTATVPSEDDDTVVLQMTGVYVVSSIKVTVE